MKTKLKEPPDGSYTVAATGKVLYCPTLTEKKPAGDIVIL